MSNDATGTDTRFDGIEVGDQVRHRIEGWLLVVKVVAYTCTITWRQRVRLHLSDGARRLVFEITDGPDGTIEVIKGEPKPSAVTLLRLISARADGEIGGPAVDAKIAELTERFGVTVTTS